MFPASCFPLLASHFTLPAPQSSVARTTRRNTTPRLPSAGPEARVQPGETPLQDCPAPGRRPAYNPAKHHSKIAQRRAGGPRTTRRNTTPRLPSAGPEARVQPGETPLQDCPAPGRRPAYNPAKHHCKIAQRRAGGPRTTRRNTTARLPSAGPQARVQPGETPLQDCPAPGRRPAYNPAKHHSKIAQRRAGGPRTTRRKTTPRLPSAGPEALRGAYNPAERYSKIAQRQAGGPQSSVFAPAFALYLQELQ